MKRGIWFLGLAVLLSACAPVASAPVGGGGTRVCSWVREAVANGSMPLWQAQEWYPDCGPYEVPL